ncbi:unnamed protein product [Thlaspi arvense]|uniref:Uncharacterized protein n=1 Tax=Thlaspi arvense TaxID=13288 RepID=A0AAU9RV36_THLAR|nr:unnamed protein product [Thlaspi arvense]
MRMATISQPPTIKDETVGSVANLRHMLPILRVLLSTYLKLPCHKNLICDWSGRESICTNGERVEVNTKKIRIEDVLRGPSLLNWEIKKQAHVQFFMMMNGDAIQDAINVGQQSWNCLTMDLSSMNNYLSSVDRNEDIKDLKPLICNSWSAEKHGMEHIPIWLRALDQARRMRRHKEDEIFKSIGMVEIG